MDNEKRNKMKETLAPVAVFVGGGAALAVAYLLGGKVTELKISVGTMRLHEAGLIKYFNEKGAEVGIEEAINVVKRFAVNTKK